MSAKSILRGYLDSLDRQEKIEFVQLAKAWGNAYQLVREQVEVVANSPTPDRLMNFQSSLTQANVRFAQVSSRTIASEQRGFGEQGIKSARQMLNLSGRKYRELPLDAVNRYIGVTSEGQALDDFLFGRYEENGRKAASALIERSSLTATVLTGLVLKFLTQNLAKTYQTARTEQMFTFRGAQTDQFVESGLVQMKNWVGEPDACSLICEPGIEASPYPLDYEMSTHPNCRCGWEPVLVPIRETI